MAQGNAVASALDIRQQYAYYLAMSMSAHSPPRLTARDLGIIDFVVTYGGCAVSHVHARFWPDTSSPSACYRRLGMLVAARYLRMQQLPSLAARGSGKALLTLGPKGRRLLSDRLDESELRSLGRREDVAAFFAEHHFAICDFRVALEQAAEDNEAVALREWIVESRLKRHPMRVTDTRTGNDKTSRIITLIPDGAFRLVCRGQDQAAYLEMDMGTISHKRLQRRLRGYLLLNKAASTAVPLFFVTTCTDRADGILTTIDHEAENIGADPTIIFVTTREQITKGAVLTAPIWRQARVAKPVAILPPEPMPNGAVLDSLAPAKPLPKRTLALGAVK